MHLKKRRLRLQGPQNANFSGPNLERGSYAQPDCWAIALERFNSMRKKVARRLRYRLQAPGY